MNNTDNKINSFPGFRWKYLLLLFLSNINGLYVPYYKGYKSVHSNFTSVFLTVVYSLMAPKMWHRVPGAWVPLFWRNLLPSTSGYLQHNIVSQTRWLKSLYFRFVQSVTQERGVYDIISAQNYCTVSQNMTYMHILGQLIFMNSGVNTLHNIAVSFA